MKKLFSAVFALAFLIFSFTGCSSDPVALQDTSDHSVITMEDGTLVNESFHQETMTTLDGTSFLLENVNTYYTSPEMGFGIAFTDLIKTALEKGQFEMVIASPYAVYEYYVPLALEEEGLTENEDIVALLQEKAFSFAGVFRLPAGDAEAEAQFALFSSTFEKTEKICTAFDADYYFGFNEDYSAFTLTEAEKTELQALVADKDNIKMKTFIFPPTEVQGSSFEGNFHDFETTTLSGETVTEDIFADYDLTLVKIWTTWCNNCISEMQEVASLQSQLPEGVNMISICIDGADDLELTQEIVDYMGIEYPTLLSSDSLNQSVLNYISAVPTTLFVDAEGNIIGDPLLGVPAKSGEIAEGYLKEVEKRLTLENK